MSRVSNLSDCAQAHRARIAVKHLRYLLEPVSEIVPGAQPLVKDLAKLQDDLGALHDAQIFGSGIARLLCARCWTAERRQW